MDSHCEANHGWLEPIVQRISDERTAIVCPMIDSISDNTLAYHGDWSLSTGGAEKLQKNRIFSLKKMKKLDFFTQKLQNFHAKLTKIAGKMGFCHIIVQKIEEKQFFFARKWLNFQLKKKRFLHNFN